MRRRRLVSVLIAAAAVVALAPPASAQQASPRIVGGTGATITDYPYQVRLVIRSNAIMESQCGGAIRDATHVVTAAHCVTDDTLLSRQPTAPANVSVRFGSADTASQGTAAVSAVTISGGYAARDDNYDAALIELSQPLPGYGGPNVNRIPFAGAAELEAAVGAGQNATATGFGVTSNGSATVSPTMRAVSLPLRDDSVCSSYYGAGSYSPALAVCAGGTGTAPANNPDTCQGDSGGPLVIESAGVRKLVGLTSRGDQCGQAGVPAVYTETSNPQICATLGGGAECTTAVPTATPRATQDTLRPSARVSSLRCRKRTCTFKVRASDKGGRVRGVTARFYRRVRVCRVRGGRRTCRTVLRTKKVKTKAVSGGYRGKATLRLARYRLDAVAVDTAGNRSKAARKRFTVKKR